MKQPALAAVLLAALIQPAMASKLISLEELSDIRAGEAPQFIVSNSQSVTASSTANVISAGSLISGGVFSQNAFSGFSGIGNIVVNTGNNNAIQGTLSVTVVGQPH